jgi:hypothetical protein
MVVLFPPERLRRNSERPTAIADVLVPTGPNGYRSADIPLGTPTTSARTRRGLWALYAAGDGQAIVVHPGGALAGPCAEVAEELRRLTTGEPLERQVGATFCAFLRGHDSAPAPVRPPARPAQPAERTVQEAEPATQRQRLAWPAPAAAPAL